MNDTTRTVWNERALHLLLSLMVPEQVLQFARPHDAWRSEWMRGWDRARADHEAGKVEVG